MESDLTARATLLTLSANTKWTKAYQFISKPVVDLYTAGKGRMHCFLQLAWSKFKDYVHIPYMFTSSQRNSHSVFMMALWMSPPEW